jgi:hypothetical protein
MTDRTTDLAALRLALSDTTAPLAFAKDGTAIRRATAAKAGKVPAAKADIPAA